MAGCAGYSVEGLVHEHKHGKRDAELTVRACAGANAMAISLARGERATLAKVDAFADGVAVKTVGCECFRLCRELVDGIVLVDNR